MLVNCPIAVKYSSDKIPFEIFGDVGKIHAFALSGENSESGQNITQFHGCNAATIGDSLISCPFLINRLGRCDAITNELSEFLIKTDKGDTSSFFANINVAISNEQSYKVGEFVCPLFKKAKVYLPISTKFSVGFISGKTSFIAEEDFAHSQMPSRAVNRSSTICTGNHFPSFSVGSGQLSPINHNITSSNIICQKCGAVKCSLGLEDYFIESMIKAGCPEGGLILDPFMGSGTVALTSKLYDRFFTGCELNPKYIKMSKDRLKSLDKEKAKLIKTKS